ncbi:MAG TPA: DUF4278 domain-containing protein [Coleofasciculaceae cyanobacterium]
MQLKYRGTTYETGTAQSLEVGTVQNLEMVSTKPVNNLKYRGVVYRLNQVAQVESLNTVLKYRGAAYNPATVTPTTTVQERARLLTLDRQRAEKNRQQSVLTRFAVEVGIAG